MNDVRLRSSSALWLLPDVQAGDGSSPGAPPAAEWPCWRRRVLTLNQVAVAEGRDAGDDEREPRRLGGQVKRPRPHVLAEQEHPQQAGRQRVEDREPGL